MEHKARGGAGIVTLGEANVCDGGNHTPEMEKTQENVVIYAEIAQAIHEHNAVACVELTHGGMNADPRYNKNPNLIVGPCEIDSKKTFRGARVRAMTTDDMEYVANGFAEAAEYYFYCGFDTVQVHCAHGWLLPQFLSAGINKRTDEYGGSFENRMRFPLYVLKKIRERIGPQKPLIIRLSGSERTPEGFTPEDIVEFLVKAQEYIDMAEISSEDFRYVFASTYMMRGQNAFLAETIKKSGRVNIPIFTVGSIIEPEQAEELISSGAVDGVSMARALIADPFLPKKAALGQADEITPCLRCLLCTSHANVYRRYICSVNPLVCHEQRLGFGGTVERAKDPKKVLIVGGGPAGLQAAITACQRGHDVTLVEQSGELGGNLRFTQTDSIKHDLRRFTEYIIRKAGSSGARILLNTKVTDVLVNEICPDHIIVATGSEYIVPEIKGIEKARHATEVYYDFGFEPGENVVIIGGGLVGVETGLHLRNLGKNVTVLEALDDYVRDAIATTRAGVMSAAQASGTQVITGTKVIEITDSGLVYEKDSETVTVPADTVLYATGMRSNNMLYFDLYNKAPAVTLVGDAKKVGKVDGAIHTGFFAAMDV